MALLKLYSEHRLNEDWFLRSVGFRRAEEPKKGNQKARYLRNNHDSGGHGLRLYGFDNGERRWVASCSFRGYRSPFYEDVVAAYTAGCLANWGDA